MTESKQSTLLVVEDHPELVQALTEMVGGLSPPWVSKVVESDQAALDYVRTAYREMRAPALVSVDLGLEPLPEKADVGLALLRQLRSEFDSLRLVVHSGLEPEPECLREILALPASYVQVRDHAALKTLATMVPLLALGYVVYSPKASVLLSSTVSNKPDPLLEEEWTLLRENANRKRYLTQQGIADLLYKGEVGRVNRMMQQIASKLTQAGFISIDITAESKPNKYRKPLETFYRENHVRFCR